MCAVLTSVWLCAAMCVIPAFVLLPQTLVTDQHEEMADAKEDGTPMPLAHYHVGDSSHIILRINVSALSPFVKVVVVPLLA